MATMIPVKSITYLGVPAQCWEVREGDHASTRTVYVRWLAKAVGQPIEYEAGTVTARTMTGNPRRHNSFRELVPMHVVQDGSPTDIVIKPDQVDDPQSS